MRKNLLLVLILFLLLVTPSILAWGPSTHSKLVSSLFDNPESKIIQDCEPYKDAFLLGSVTPDLSVIFYYTNGGENYKLTHNHNFANEVMQQAVTPDEVCFAYGISAHQITDSVSHNLAVPSAIRGTFIPNWLIHPLLEQKYDAYQLKHTEGLREQTEHMMDALYGEKGDRYVEMVQDALGENVDLDVKNEMVKLSYALGSFYDEVYKPRGETFIFKVYPYLSKFTVILEPILGGTNSGDTELYFEKSEELLTNAYNNWGSRYQISPHGFSALKEADSFANWFNWIYIIIMILPSALLIWITRKWWWIFLIPIVFIIELFVVYALI